MILEDLKPYCWQIQTTHPYGRARDDAACSVSTADYVRMAKFVGQTRQWPTGGQTEVLRRRLLRLLLVAGR